MMVCTKHFRRLDALGRDHAQGRYALSVLLLFLAAAGPGCATGTGSQQVVPAVAAGQQTSGGVTPAAAVNHPDTITASRHVSAALEAYQAGDVERALRETSRAREADPGLSSTYELEAMMSADAGDPDGQARALLAVAASHPDAAHVQHAAGLLLVHTPYRREGLAALRSAIEASPRSADYVRDLAGVYVELGQTDEAIEVLRQGLSRIPTDRTLPISLARLYESVGNWESALRFYTVSLRHEPGHAGWRRQRARCLYRIGAYADAAEEFQRCLETDVVSLTQTDRIEFGDACLQTGDLGRAAWLFDELAAEGLATREVEVLRGVCALRQGQTAEAEQIFASALERWPNDVSLALLLKSSRK